MNKVMDLDQVIDLVKDGDTIMLGGFLAIGAPLKCIERLAQKKVKNLTLITIVGGNPGCGDEFDLNPLFVNKQVKKMITAHAGTSPKALENFKAGDMEIEYFPMGTWIEKVRAGGAGLGAVITPVGVGTLMEEGKQKITIDGREYLVELPLTADFAFIKGYRGDAFGNVEYRDVSINSNPTLATAARYTVAEVNEIVEPGQIEPIRVGTPGVFVKAVVQGYTLEEQEKLITDLWVRTNRLAQ